MHELSYPFPLHTETLRMCQQLHVQRAEQGVAERPGQEMVRSMRFPLCQPVLVLPSGLCTFLTYWCLGSIFLVASKRCSAAGTSPCFPTPLLPPPKQIDLGSSYGFAILESLA